MRNIAFDSSCLVERNSSKKNRNSRRGTGHENQDTVHIGSVFGACQSSEDSSNPCVVEDVVSSANASLPSSGMEAFVGGSTGAAVETAPSGTPFTQAASRSLEEEERELPAVALPGLAATALLRREREPRGNGC